MKNFSIFLIASLTSFSAFSDNGFYNAPIKQLQGEGLGDPYNSIHLNMDITDSPCDSTNQSNRFAISDNVHQSFALAALMAGKKVYIASTRECNAVGIEKINYIMIKASE